MKSTAQFTENAVLDKRERGYEYLRQAAEAGAVDAQFQLGIDYSQGFHGQHKDERAAVEWFRKAAEQGMSIAAYDLAMVVHTDPAETYFWLGVAIPGLKEEMVEKATVLRDVAATSLTAEQRTAIDERMRRWLSEHAQP